MNMSGAFFRRNTPETASSIPRLTKYRASNRWAFCIAISFLSDARARRCICARGWGRELVVQMERGVGPVALGQWLTAEDERDGKYQNGKRQRNGNLRVA